MAVTFPVKPTGISTRNVPSLLVVVDVCQVFPPAVPSTSTVVFAKGLVPNPSVRMPKI